MQKRNLLTGSALGIITAVAMSSTATAQLEDEVIVTATKRSESASDIPIAVSALGEDTLDELRVSVFTDYLVQLPDLHSRSSVHYANPLCRRCCRPDAKRRVLS